MASRRHRSEVLRALVERQPRLALADELRAELADVHDIDQALTATS